MYHPRLFLPCARSRSEVKRGGIPPTLGLRRSKARRVRVVGVGVRGYAFSARAWRIILSTRCRIKRLPEVLNPASASCSSNDEHEEHEPGTGLPALSWPRSHPRAAAHMPMPALDDRIQRATLNRLKVPANHLDSFGIC